MHMTRNGYLQLRSGSLHPVPRSTMMVPMIDQSIQRSLSLEARSSDVMSGVQASLQNRIDDPDLRRDCTSIAQTIQRYAVQAVAVDEPELVGQYVRWTRKSLHQSESLAGLLVSIIDAFEIATAELRDAMIVEAMAPSLAAARAALNGNLPADELPNEIDAGTAAGQCALRFLGAVLEGNRQQALDLIAQGVEGKLSVHEVMHDVILPAQRMVGNLWHAGEITIADEHFATATADMALTSLRPYYPVVEPRNERVILGTVSGDLHAIGARIASDCFEMDGWQPVYLGPNTPAQDLLQAALDYDARVLALSTTSALYLREAAVLIRNARALEETKSLKIIVGGQVFDQYNDLWNRIGADAHALTPAEAPQRARELLGLD